MHSKLIITTALILALCFIASPCGGAWGADDSQKTLAKDNNAFAVDLYRNLAQDEGNIFFSPYSISVALAMTYMGARGRTAEQMASTLHFSLKGDALHRSFGALVKKMNDAGKKGNYRLSVANRLWGQKGYTFLRGFLEGVKKNYDAPLELLDFEKETEKSRVTINTWVEKMTQDRIKDLLQPGVLTQYTKLVLTNAIYFKGDWQTKFKKESTGKEPFYVTAKKKTDVDMMHQKEDLRYGRSGAVGVLEIPYKSRELSMVILLPDKKEGLPELQRTLTSKRLEQMCAGLSRREVNLSLPRFKSTSAFVLNKVLTKMGMKDAFTGDADFSGMNGKKTLFISAAIHKAFVAVDEEGTEAAAATAIVMSDEACEPETVEFRVDHPFMFLIRDTQSGSILFMGRICRPGN